MPNFQNLPLGPLHVNAAAGAPLLLMLPLPGDTPWRLVSASFCPDADVAAHGTDAVKLQVLSGDGTYAVAEWSSKSDAQGALTNGSPVVVPMASRGATYYGADHAQAAGNSDPSPVRIAVSHEGSGQAISGQLLLVMAREARTEAYE